MDPSRFDVLLDLYLAGSATPAEEAELEALLRADAGRRRRFAERLLLEVHLRKAFAGIAVPRPPPPRRWLPFPRRVVVLAAAAAVLLVIGLALVGVFGRGKNPIVRNAATGRGEPQPEARGSDVLAGEVRMDAAAVKRIPDGQWFEIVGDVPALVRLPDNTEAEFAPASKAILRVGADRARRVVEIERGGAKFKVTSGGAFQVKTSVGTVTALGTEFSVKLEVRGKREDKRREGRGTLALVVAVTEGSVRVEVGEKSYVLAAGESRSFGETRKKDDDD